MCTCFFVFSKEPIGLTEIWQMYLLFSNGTSKLLLETNNESALSIVHAIAFLHIAI